MSRLFGLVRAIQDGTLSAEQRAALERLVIAVDVAVEVDADPRAPWSAAAHAYRELVVPSNVHPLRRTGCDR